MGGYYYLYKNYPIPEGYRVEYNFTLDDLDVYKLNKLLPITHARYKLRSEGSRSISVCICTQGFFGEKLVKIGYIPADVAFLVEEKNQFAHLIFRPQSIQEKWNGKVLFWGELLAPKKTKRKSKPK